jgi:hypothetical protein
MNRQAGMTIFSITLSEDRFESCGDMAALGSLQIGDFVENFHAPLSYWDRKKYLSQWCEALERLIDGESHSALVTSMYDPRTANFIRWWPLYRIGDSVHFQEHALLMDDLEQPFDETDIYKSVPRHETTSEDDGRISEWVAKLSDIEVYLASEKPRMR